jgi:hypothetical protein
MIHTIILLVLVYAAIKAALRAIFKRKPYKIQLVSRYDTFTPAARESGSTNPPDRGIHVTANDGEAAK